ncbi:DUF7310 family coiled-coil domain-containing protein [Halobellus salinisoli]|uniref:DUF7310 family coiled-coil domain-containing protein n=1 Tax=Halobellus salinisoli TaxID=3108500 RepID=UPI00300A0ACD
MTTAPERDDLRACESDEFDAHPTNAGTIEAGTGDRVPDTDADVASLERRLASVEAELDAVRGLLGGVDAVDEAVERRASIALAKVESLEERLKSSDGGLVRERLPETGARKEISRSRTAHSTATADDGSQSPDASGERELGAGTVEPRRSDDERESLATRLRDAFQ